MQGRGNDFRLIHSNALDVLAGVLAERLRSAPPGDDWLRPDTVLVPQFSMRRWLQQTLAERLGICANLHFLTPGEFVDAALDANLGAAPPGDRLPPAQLRWRLLRALRDAPPAAWRGFLDDNDPRRAWTLACALADSFERYQAWRRDLLLRWEAGAEPDDPQAQLWRQVAGGRAHRARRIGAYLQRYSGDSAGVPVGLPPRLLVFACQNVSPDVLQVIASQSRAGVQEFFLHTPSRAFWGDLGRWAADYLPAEDERFSGEAANPLLAAWGQAGRDFVATLGGGEAVQARYEALGFVEPSPARLLGRLQADVLDNLAPAASLAARRDSDWPRARLDAGDDSLQFHACHTPLREVQVLHDRIRALLEAPPRAGEAALQPREIAVLAPDIDRYAAHVEAVFGGALGSAREIPYTLADTRPLAQVPLAETFLRVLELPLRPLTLPGLLDLLAVPAIAERFALDAAAQAALGRWLTDAGARRAFDGDDRARFDAETEADAGGGNAYTFAFALERLLLGYASGDEGDIAGVAPWPALEGQSTQVLDALLRVLAALRTAASRLCGPQPPTAWAEALGETLSALFADEPRDPQERATLARLRETVAEFADSAAAAGFGDDVAHAVVRDALRAALDSDDARAPFLSGGVCFGRMVPIRLIPFRAICLLGMDEAAFPARDGRDPLDRINRGLEGGERRVGDPSRRDADRYLFLQLLTAASRAFSVSWVGMDARDGTPREPSSVVSELLAAAARYHDGDAEAIQRALVVRHALQPFSAAAFGAALPDETVADPRRFSFDARWHAAAGVSGLAPPPAFAATPLDAAPAPAGAAVTLRDLARDLARPHAAYLREGLGLRLPEEDAPPEDHEPFGTPGGLARHGLRTAVFEAWRRNGARPDVRTLHARLLAEARLAPGADGLAALDGVLDEIAPFARKALADGFDGEATTRALDVSIGDLRLLGTLDGVHGDRVLRVALSPNGRHGGHALRHGIAWLAASLLGLPICELAAEKKGAAPRIVRREALAEPQARAALASLLALRRQALRIPLPFLPKSGYVWWREAALRAQAKGDTERALDKASQEWCGGDSADWGAPPEAGNDTGLALRGRDPFVDGDVAARDAFEALAQRVFDAVEHGTAFAPESWS